jgi:methionyl-tRNA formyltransferase
MNILIITMDDPIQTKAFIGKIVVERKNDIVGLAISSGNRLTLSKNKSKYEYILSLLMIMGFYHFLKNSLITIHHKVKRKLHSKFPSFISDPTIQELAAKYGIKTWRIKTPNNKNFLDEVRKLDVDVIINQSQNILKSELLSIPKIGVINRHNALLPRNRGRLTPFWVSYKEEKETGVSIHFVTEEIDAGEIIIQKKFALTKDDNFNTIVGKNYELAPIAMLEALDKLEKGETNFIKNDHSLATYNTTPTIKEAWEYRKRKMFRFSRAEV